MSILAVVAAWADDPARRDRARRMIEPLAERAPDGRASVEAPGAALAFGKLVVSRRQGHAAQPLSDAAAGLYLVADVRIDNRDELRPTLGLPAAATDAELVLAGYRQWGVALPDHLVGDFAFAVWDARARRLFAARDPFGVRPLYYRRLPDGALLVASDVESILAVDPGAWKVDDQAVIDHLLSAWPSPERTFWEPIRALPAGHALLASAADCQVQRWWRPPAVPAILADHETCYRELRRRLRQAVADRLDADHPVLVHLSGGFDSTAIATLAGTIEARAPLRAVGAVYPGLGCDESLYMDAVRARLPYPTEYWDGTRPLSLDLDAPALAGPGLRTCLNDGTRGDQEIARREGARAVLSGLGGDVWQPCNESQRDYLRRGHWRQLWQAAFMRPGMSWGGRARVLRWSLGQETPEAIRALGRRLRRRAPAAAPPWLARPATRDPLPPAPEAQALARSHGLAQARRLLDLGGPRPVHALARMQVVAAANQVEMRFPFLDVRLVDLLWRLPLTIWGPPGYPARLHPLVLRDLLPPEVTSRRWKTDFSAALAARAALAWRALRARSDPPGHLLLERYCRGSHIAALAGADLPQSPLKADRWSEIWRLAVLEAWLEMVYGQARSRLTSRGEHGHWPESNNR